ncbi:MAG: hypothetical protein ACREQL_06455 [Candidatus Binatia bacterium]
MKTMLLSLALAVGLATAGVAAADECRDNCVQIFRVCAQGCVDNYSGIMRRACKIGCRKAKKVSIRTCRAGNPQACPPIE